MARKFHSFDEFVSGKKEAEGSLDENAEVAKAKLDINKRSPNLRKSNKNFAKMKINLECKYLISISNWHSWIYRKMICKLKRSI